MTTRAAEYPAGTPVVSADPGSPNYRPDAIDYGNPDLSVVCLQLIRKIRENHVLLGLHDDYPTEDDEIMDNSFGVFFGSDTAGGFPFLPVVLVEGMDVDIELDGTQHRVTNLYKVDIIICHANLASASSEVKWQSLRRAELLRDVLHTDLQLMYNDGQTQVETVAYGYVTGISVGSLPSRAGEIYSHLLSWQGVSKPIMLRRLS